MLVKSGSPIIELNFIFTLKKKKLIANVQTLWGFFPTRALFLTIPPISLYHMSNRPFITHNIIILCYCTVSLSWFCLFRLRLHQTQKQPTCEAKQSQACALYFHTTPQMHIQIFLMLIHICYIRSKCIFIISPHLIFPYTYHYLTAGTFLTWTHLNNRMENTYYFPKMTKK